MDKWVFQKEPIVIEQYLIQVDDIYYIKSMDEGGYINSPVPKEFQNKEDYFDSLYDYALTGNVEDACRMDINSGIGVLEKYCLTNEYYYKELGKTYKKADSCSSIYDALYYYADLLNIDVSRLKIIKEVEERVVTKTYTRLEER